MGVANPIWLWGLTGLLVPLAIHLLSRKDMRIIRVGSLRHLEHATTRQAIRIQLNAYLLLALRCLIVALVALLLAELYLTTQQSTTRWVLVEGNLGQSKPWRTVIDSLERQGYEARRWQPGFPLLTDEVEDLSPPDAWALSEQLANKPLDRCVVISRDRFVGFAGARPARNPNLTWLTAQSDSTRFVLLAVQSGDSVAMRLGRSTERHTLFETIRLPAAQAVAARRAWSGQPGAIDSVLSPGQSAQDDVNSLRKPQPVRIVLTGTTIDNEERRVVTAALRAVGNNGIQPIQWKELSPDGITDGDWLIWLSADEPPNHGIANVIRKSPDANATTMPDIAHDGPLLARASNCGTGRMDDNGVNTGAGDTDTIPSASCWVLTRTLSASTAHRGQFTLQLATILLGAESRTLNRTAEQYDRRLQPESEVFSIPQSTANRATAPSKEKRSAGDVLAVVLVALLATERFIANRQQL